MNPRRSSVERVPIVRIEGRKSSGTYGRFRTVTDIEILSKRTNGARFLNWLPG